MTLQEIELIIKNHSPHIPDAANIIMVHRDGRIMYAERFEQGCNFWDSNSMLTRKLQGIIHGCTVIAKRQSGKWFPAPTTKSAVPDFVKEQMAKSTKPPVLTPAVVEKKAVVIEVKPVVVERPQNRVDIPPVLAQPSTLNKDTKFTSLRELENPMYRRADKLLVSIRRNGKLVISKSLREALSNTFEFIISEDRQWLGITRFGNGYKKNVSGNYTCRGLVGNIDFPDDKPSIRVNMAWNEELQMFVGKIGG